MRKLVAVSATGVLALLTGSVNAGAAGSAGTNRQTASYAFTTSQQGAPTGFSFSADFHNPTDPSGKPYSVSTIIVQLPAGTTWDDGAAPQCTATDAQLYAEGAGACPSASRTGSGKLITDFGSPAGLQRYGDNTITQFNAKGQVIGYAETTNPPTRAVSHTRVNGDTLTTPVPAFPGFPPPDPFLAFKALRLSGPAIVTNGRALVTTPQSCPTSGHWTFKLTFVYYDGVSQTVSSSYPCATTRPAG